MDFPHGKCAFCPGPAAYVSRNSRKYCTIHALNADVNGDGELTVIVTKSEAPWPYWEHDPVGCLVLAFEVSSKTDEVSQGLPNYGIN